MPNTWRNGLMGPVVVLVAACGSSPEPRLEASPSVEVPLPVTSPTQAPTQPAPTDDTGSDIYMVSLESRATTPLLSVPGSQGNAELSPDGRRIVYESGVPGVPSQIFVLKADGTKRKLTHMKRGASDPTWSPDGTQIAFAGFRPRDADRHPDSDIFVMNADGSTIRRFAGTPNDDGHPDWSPDGSRIAFHSRDVSDEGLPSGLIWVASVRDRTLTRLSRSNSAFADVDPAWSPDGRWIAYGKIERSTINGRILHTWLGLMRPNGTHSRRIRRAYAYHVIENPSWSPDGRSIVFEENRPPAVGVRWDGTVGSVGIIDVRTERLRWIVRDEPSDQPSWGPGGILVSLTRARAVTPLDTTWDPSWSGRPDATIVLTGSRCEQDGDAGPLRPGVLTIEFVNESYRDATFKVVRPPQGRRLADLRVGPFIAGGWGERNPPSTTDIWSSPREVTSGRWAVVCFKDLIAAPNGFQLVRAGVVGPFEIG